MLAQILRPLIAANLLLAIIVASYLMGNPGLHPAIGILIGWFIVPLLHAVILGLAFIAGWLISVGRPQVEPTTFNRRGPLLFAWLAEVVAAWRTYGIAQPFLGNRPLASAQNGDRVPVVLVHGYICNRAVWRPLARWLAARGHPVGSVNLEPIFGSLDDMTDHLDREIRRLRRLTGTRRVALVGHSMGGLVIRAYLRDFGTRRVSHVVTLGTPHRGSFWARFGTTANARQMRPKSRWLRRLRASETGKERPPSTNILTLHDHIVVPPGHQVQEAAEVHMWTGVGHLDMVYRRGVWRQIGAAINAKAEPAGAKVSSLRTEAA